MYRILFLFANVNYIYNNTLKLVFFEWKNNIISIAVKNELLASGMVSGELFSQPLIFNEFSF